MIPVQSTSEARRRLLDDICLLVETVRRTLAGHIGDLASGVEMLDKLRRCSYENTNQYQHAALLPWGALPRVLKGDLKRDAVDDTEVVV